MQLYEYGSIKHKRRATA
ncbi:hypothetical protein Goklo_025107 [Gossypium klotzschianum]|uniref:Uncharacterized protein n=1 Tax=Gossypium klotzschianum TaxID=34286 RepID=A0A7J8WEH4_9ROSI|nr:hypothetical protein [Gossypium klotzschianum]